MAESGRKRCRKSKLVPRDCADFFEEDAVLQDFKEPPQKKLLLEKIKKEPVDYVPQASSAHEFSVNVEVEDMEGSIPEENSTNYMKYLFSLSTESQGEPIENIEFVDNNLLIEKRPVLEDEKSCTIDTNKLIRMLAYLHKKYPDEKEVVMHTRNQWGRVFVERLSDPSGMTTQEIQLQHVLRQWRNWTACTSSRIRESPFTYKCYVCETAWWTFTEFSGHLTLHPEVKLQLELLQQECNIVAYEGTPPVVKDLHVHGKCLKCAKTYEHHMSNRIETDSYYYCNYCKDRFQTCGSLAKHEGACDKNPIRVLSISQHGKQLKFSDFSCQVCGTVFLSKPDLSEHLTICHKVRSDEPIFTKLKTCQLCKLSYFNFNFHACLKKHGNHECKHCHGKFQNKHLLQYHVKVWAGVVRCRICDKFIRRSCMAAEHYALHSQNFEIVHRCLVCKKTKVFVSDEAVRIHRSKYHTNIDPRRPRTEKIIMSKLMLQQCFIDINAKKTVPKIRHKATSCPKSDHFKLTRGETMQQVRVYAPVKKKAEPVRRKTDNSNKESQVANTTFAHDNIVSMRSEPPENDDNIVSMRSEPPENDDNIVSMRSEPPENDDNIVSMRSEPPENDVIQVKKEKDDAVKVDIIHCNEHDKEEPRKEDKENYTVHASVDFGKIVIKSEKLDDSFAVEKIPEQSNAVGKENKVTKNSAELMEELNEFLDIKPDIIRIKEEKVSDDEATENLSSLFQISDTSNVTNSDISKVFRASSAFAEEVTDNSEHSKVFRVSQGLLESEAVIKKEIKEEPEDSSVLNSSTDSKKDFSDNSDGSLLNLEPEVILQAGYRKRKIYSCRKCDFSAYHREYKEHINSNCGTSNNKQEVIDSLHNYKCTKCNVTFPNIKRYALHFEKYHLYQFMSCPQCRATFDSVTKLVPHLNGHIRNQFVRLQLLGTEETGNSKTFQCKTCKEIEDTRGSFVHWEKHLELSEEPLEPAVEPFKGGSKGEKALKAGVLKDVLAALVRDDKPQGPDVRLTKTCLVCARRFERRHDVKRHLVEHLLEDAYANIVDNMTLKCQICFKLHRKPEYYKKHMRDHASLPIYQCTICDKTFSDSSNFTKHKKIHNLRAFVCDICNKKFQAKFSLERHMVMHMKTDPITCTRCDKVFYCESFYKRHVRQHHEKPASRFKCNLCRESFSAVKDKWDHLWLVHKQRKKKADCPVCGKAYRKYYDVKKHAQDVHGMEVRWLITGKLTEALEKAGKLVDGKVVNVEGEVKKEVDSDDDCLLIEEERETLVVYD